jgi:hypothetical protein
LCFFGFSFHSFAQLDSIVEAMEAKKKAKHHNNTNNAVLVSIYYTALFPEGVLSQRFGFSNDVGANISYKVNHNWLIGVEGAYLFGAKVKEDPISNSIATYSSPGQIIGLDGTLLTPGLALSGFEIAFRVGKIIAFTKKHPNSGIQISVAPGFMDHKILITANTNNYPQLDPTYKKGYDRLTYGPSVAGYLGYLFLERKKFLSFSAGIDYAVGFTKNKRYNIDQMSADNNLRTDMLIGIKVGWVIPVFLNKEHVYY